METMTISAAPRITRGRKTNQLRAEGTVPAVIYGYDTEPTMIQINRNDAIRMYRDAGESTVVNLEVEGKGHNVLVQDVQYDPLTNFITHVDFRQVDLTKTVESTIEIKLVGEPPAVKELAGTLVHVQEEVEVEALPTALVREIEVDVSGLKTFDDVIHVSDLIIPPGITVLTDPKQVVATVQPPRDESELADLDKPVEGDVSQVEATAQKSPEEKAAADAEKSEKKDKK